MHGVPRSKSIAGGVGDRFSIIIWGRRRALNERNGGTVSLPKEISQVATVDDAIAAAHQLVARPAQATRPVDASSAATKAKKKNRLQ
jgi:hypothetical protein